MGIQQAIMMVMRRRDSGYIARPNGRGSGPGFAVALAALGLALAVPLGAAAHDSAKPFDVQNGVRVYRGPDFTTKFEPAPAPRQHRAEPTTALDRGPAAILDPMVEIPDQPPIARAGYRVRCASANSNSCPLSQVIVEVPNQPVVRRSAFRPGTVVRFGTEIRDGELVARVRVVRRGVPVHRAGLRDDLHVLVHRAGTRDDRNIRVHQAGVSSDRNIRVHQAGVSGNRNIRVHRAGIRNNANIRVHGPGG